MPRITYLQSDEQRAKEENITAYAKELRELYGGSMSLEQAGVELGLSKKSSIRNALAGCHITDVNGRERILVREFAKRCYR